MGNGPVGNTGYLFEPVGRDRKVQVRTDYQTGTLAQACRQNLSGKGRSPQASGNMAREMILGMGNPGTLPASIMHEKYLGLQFGGQLLDRLQQEPGVGLNTALEVKQTGHPEVKGSSLHG